MLTAIKKLLGMIGMSADSEMVGSICTFAGAYAPIGYMDCNGQLLSVATYTPLFAILGTRYGGDGVKTFGLPDLRPMGKDGQPDTGHNQRVDWATLGMPRQVICVVGYWPSRP
jgi:microcystin-dependent protein